MAYLNPPWEPVSTSYHYMSREALLALLTDLPAGCLITVNAVGNLAIMAAVTPAGDWYTAQLGYVDLGAEVYVPY